MPDDDTPAKPADYRDQIARRKADQERSTNRGCLIGGVAVLAFVVIVAVVGSMGGDDDTNSSDTMRLSAFDVCKDFVKDRLRSPGSAKFRNFFEDDGEVIVTGAGKGPYTVRSTVDSENGFGALIRTDFTCSVTNTSGDRWRLNSVSTDE